MDKEPITLDGLNKIKKELENLKNISRPKIVEAIAEARQLREMAEQNAKNKIIDAVTPRIRNLIERELLGEEDELSMEDDLSSLEPDAEGAPEAPAEGEPMTIDLDALAAGPALDVDLGAEALPDLGAEPMDDVGSVSAGPSVSVPADADVDVRIGSDGTVSVDTGTVNVQVGEGWAYSILAWVKDLDQLTKSTFQRSGVYSYNVSENGDYGSAKGIDLTLEFRGRKYGSQIQYTRSIAKNNSEYAWANVSGQYVDAPSQEFLQFYDRTHDFTFYLYTKLPYEINAAMTAFYQSGGPYTPWIFAGRDPKEDSKNRNSKRGPAYKNINLNFNKYIKLMGHRISLGLSVYNAFDIRNEIDVYPLTGKADDPGTYYTENIGLADENHDISSAYYDRPWRFSQPREINFNVRFDFD